MTREAFEGSTFDDAKGAFEDNKAMITCLSFVTNLERPVVPAKFIFSILNS